MPSSSSPDWTASRARFVLPPDTVYLAGNSLGALPRAVAEVSLVDGWGRYGVAGWENGGWWDAPRRLGDRLAPLLGTTPGSTVVGDSTSVHLFGALVAAARLRPDRSVLLGDAGQFPTDRYLAASVARVCGLTLRTGPVDGLRPDRDTAVVVVPAVDFRTGERWDLARVVTDAHAVGALVVVDLSHAVGVLPPELDAVDADLAVGCTYKYLSGGPGSPAFVWVAARWRELLDPPLTGWTGHARPFAMEEAWTPADGVSRLRVGTPPMLSMLALETALGEFDGLDVADLRARSLALGDTFLDALDPAVDVVTPREHARRGAHVAVRVADADARCAELARRGVVVDARPPDLLRFGFAPLYVSMADAVTAAVALGR